MFATTENPWRRSLVGYAVWVAEICPYYPFECDGDCFNTTDTYKLNCIEWTGFAWKHLLKKEKKCTCILYQLTKYLDIWNLIALSDRKLYWNFWTRRSSLLA